MARHHFSNVILPLCLNWGRSLIILDVVRSGCSGLIVFNATINSRCIFSCCLHACSSCFLAFDKKVRLGPWAERGFVVLPKVEVLHEEQGLRGNVPGRLLPPSFCLPLAFLVLGRVSLRFLI